MLIITSRNLKTRDVSRHPARFFFKSPPQVWTVCSATKRASSEPSIAH